MKQSRKSAVRARPAPAKGTSATRIVATASMLVLPMLSVSSRAIAQAGTAPRKTSSPTNPPPPPMLSLNFAKVEVPYTIVGYGDNHTIFKNAEGGYFFVDARTGDMKMLSADYFLKLSRSVTFKFTDHKGESANVRILGVDQQGHVLQKNSRGEVFYLHPTTGDFVFVKWPK